MKVQYDKTADAMYIYLSKGKVQKTVKISDRAFVDVDKKGNVIGMEVLDISKQIPKKEIGKIYTEMPVYA